MNPKEQSVTYGLDLPLDLTRNKVDIDSNFSRFEEKNSPMYNASISNLYTESTSYENRVVFDCKGNKFVYVNGVLYKHDAEGSEAAAVLETGGDGYFERKTVNHDVYDTYDFDGDNEIHSKYNNGVLYYTINKTDYTTTVSDVHSAVIAARARIVSGHPIFAYAFAMSNGNYEFVYIRDGNVFRNTNIAKLKQSYLTTSQKLAEATATTGTFQQNRGVSISSSFTEKNNEEGIGFINPLIQISNPLENVYCVSFINNHGGKLKPKDLAYWNILDNNGTCSNTLQWNTSSSTIELDQSQEMEITFRSSVDHSQTTENVYCYSPSSGWSEYDNKHSADIGKWFKTVGNDPTTNDPILQDEITFDPGYEPTFVSNTTGQYQTGSGINVQYNQYVQYQTYNATYYADKITIAGTCGDNYDNTYVTMPFTPKRKVLNAGGNTYNGQNMNYALVNQLVSNFDSELTVREEIIRTLAVYDANGNDVSLYSFDGGQTITDVVATDPVFTKSGMPSGHTQLEIYEYGTNVPIDYASIFTDSNCLFKCRCSRSAGYVALNVVHFTDGYDSIGVYPTVWLERVASSNVKANGTVYNLNVLTEKRSSSLQTIRFERVKIPITSEMAGAVTYGALPQTSFCGYNNSALRYRAASTCPTYNDYYYNLAGFADFLASKTTALPTNTSLYTVLEDPYVTWEEGDEDSFETHLDGETSSFTWTFQYQGNNNEYDVDTLFEGFIQRATVDFTDPTGTTQSDVTSLISYKEKQTVFSKVWTWKVTQRVTQILLPTVTLDDGTFVSTALAKETYVLPTSNIIALQARINSISSGNLNFTTQGYYNTQTSGYEGVVMDSSIDLNMNYYRYQLHLTNRSNSIDTTTGMMILYDSAEKDTYAYPGGLTADTSSGSGWISAHYYNNQGSIAKVLENKWRLLINSSGLISGISYGKDYYLGTLLTEWNSISDDRYVYFDDSKIGYHSTDGKWYEIEEKAGDGDIDIIFDRYVIINTNGFWNCYDIERERVLHYATDFNNRVMPGVSQNEYGDKVFVSKGRANTIGRSLSKYFVSGVNALYEVSQTAITSIQISPQAYLNICTGYESYVWCKADDTYLPQYIEIFSGTSTDATSATYNKSVICYDTTRVSLVDSALVDLNSPVAISATTQYSPNIFTKFIHTYNNKDLVQNGAYGYPIIYNETTPILSYSSAKQISNVDSIFVIQSQFYALINGKIVSVTYDDYTIIGFDAIIDITGMVYLGYLPTAAYFWSPADRCIYTFTGDANLDIAMEASKINEVYKCYYSTMKESIFITTDQGIYIISGKQQWHLPITNVDNIYFLNAGYFIVESTDGTSYTTDAFSYEKRLLENPTKLPVILQSKFVGPGNGQVATTSHLQFVLITDEKEPGEVRLTCETFTDTGFKSEEKPFKISKEDWDKENNALVLNYSPKQATGQGFKWKITSDFPIARITQRIIPKIQGTSAMYNV